MYGHDKATISVQIYKLLSSWFSLLMFCITIKDMSCLSKQIYFIYQERRRKQLLLILLLYLYIRKKSIIKRKHRHWVHDIFKQRKIYGAHNHLMKDLELDKEHFMKYFRLSKAQFVYVYEKIREDIVKYGVSRESISTRQRLAICLR